MTAITAYTSYDEIRAALGVTSEELEDVTLQLPLYSQLLSGDLYEVSPTLESDFATISAKVSPTDAEVRFLRNVRMYCTYSLAVFLTTTLPLFTAKQVTDSKAGMQRFDKSYQEVAASVGAMFDQALKRLEASVVEIGGTTKVRQPRAFFGIASPSSDPVTGS